jgi:hypothetical protein
MGGSNGGAGAAPQRSGAVKDTACAQTAPEHKAHNDTVTFGTSPIPTRKRSAAGVFADSSATKGRVADIEPVRSSLAGGVRPTEQCLAGPGFSGMSILRKCQALSNDADRAARSWRDRRRPEE